MRENTAVLIEDGVIRRVADDRERCPEGARPIDLGRRVLMPGLIDAHTHAAGRVPHTAKGAEEPLPGIAAHFLQAELRDYLRLGVTTIRVTGSQGLTPQEARQAMRYGAFRGPRLLTCGKIISATAPGGRFYGDMYREADGPDDIRRAVREQIRAGADFIKVMTTGARSNELEDPEPLQLTEPELAAVTGEAHRLGYRVAAHAEGLDGCAAAIRHGADTIEHGMYLHQRPDLLAAMAAAARSWCRRCRATTGWPAWRGGDAEPAGAAAAGQPAAHADPGMPPMLTGAGPPQPGAGRRQHARRPGGRCADRARQRRDLATGLEIERMVQHGLTPPRRWRPRPALRPRPWAWPSTSAPWPKASCRPDHRRRGPADEPELLSDPGRIWLVLQLGVPVAGQALTQGQPAHPLSQVPGEGPPGHLTWRRGSCCTGYGFAVAYLACFAAVELTYTLLDPDAQARLIAWASTNVANLKHEPVGLLPVSAFVTPGYLWTWPVLIALALFGANRALGNVRTALVCLAGHVIIPGQRGHRRLPDRRRPALRREPAPGPTWAVRRGGVGYRGRAGLRHRAGARAGRRGSRAAGVSRADFRRLEPARRPAVGHLTAMHCRRGHSPIIARGRAQTTNPGCGGLQPVM